MRRLSVHFEPMRKVSKDCKAMPVSQIPQVSPIRNHLWRVVASDTYFFCGFSFVKYPRVLVLEAETEDNFGDSSSFYLLLGGFRFSLSPPRILRAARQKKKKWGGGVISRLFLYHV